MKAKLYNIAFLLFGTCIFAPCALVASVHYAINFANKPYEANSKHLDIQPFGDAWWAAIYLVLFVLIVAMLASILLEWRAEERQRP